jgi:CubicO group peptidase (beta-lactamase class C family)
MGAMAREDTALQKSAAATRTTAMALFRRRPRSGPTDIRIDAERSAQIDDYIAELIQPNGPGLTLAVTESGETVHAAGYGLADIGSGRPIAPDTIFHLASCGKQFTALGILMLAGERKLGLDDPIGKHLRALVGFGPGVTLRRLLNHTSGIRDFYDEAGIDEMLARNERPTNADVIQLCADLGCPMAADRGDPGDAFCYGNTGYDLLGAVIEHVSGQSYHDFFQQRVFDPLGMRDTFSVPDQRAGDRRCATGYVRDDRGEFVEQGGSEYDGLVGSGSFYTTVEDLCRYDQALNANSLVSEAAMREAFTGGRTNDGEFTNYGFGWNLGDYNGVPFADHEGEWIGFYSYITRYLERPLSIFVLANHPDLDFADIANVATEAYG